MKPTCQPLWLHLCNQFYEHNCRTLHLFLILIISPHCGFRCPIEDILNPNCVTYNTGNSVNLKSLSSLCSTKSKIKIPTRGEHRALWHPLETSPYLSEFSWVTISAVCLNLFLEYIYIYLPMVAQTVKNLPACNAGDLGLIPGLGRFPGRGHGNPPQYSCLQNPHGQRSLAGYSP